MASEVTTMEHAQDVVGILAPKDLGRDEVKPNSAEPGCVSMEEAKPEEAGQTSEQYVDLGDAFPKTSFWSNDPADMKLDLYFSRDPFVPGLPSSYNMPQLRPIIVKPDLNSGHTYLLTDTCGHYYIWNECHAMMLQFREEGLRLEEVVYKVRTDTWGGNEVEEAREREESD